MRVDGDGRAGVTTRRVARLGFEEGKRITVVRKEWHTDQMITSPIKRFLTRPVSVTTITVFGVFSHADYSLLFFRHLVLQFIEYVTDSMCANFEAFP
jgi:hypothetical protein